MGVADRYGPWAVVAGASEGTGSALARRIAAQGVSCVLLARREGPLAALAEQIRAEGGAECVTATVDLAAPDAVDRIAEAVGSREVGLFVGNAGADPNGAEFLDQDIAAWDELVQRNVVTTMRCCHHFGAPMRERGRGGLLLMNSGACYGGASSMAAYSASKAFVLCLAESLWSELGPLGVDVLTVVLGRTDTPAFRALLAANGQPVPDGLAAPDDVAEVALARLPHGPIHNWGNDDDQAGFSPSSARARRERVEMVTAASRSVFAK
jgi:short-subunit dehydrogenase